MKNNLKTKELQLKNIKIRESTLSISHLDISGSEAIDMQFKNNPSI